MEGREEYLRLTAGGTSATVASKSQITPLKHIYEWKSIGQQGSPPYLFPKELGQTKFTTTVPAQVEQATKHNKK